MQSRNQLNVFTLLTDIDLKPEEIPFLRGAMIRLAGNDNIDFHDHEMMDSDIHIRVFNTR